MCIWKESVYSAIVGSGILKISIRSSWLVMLFKLSIPLLIFYLINYYERNVEHYHYNCGFFSLASQFYLLRFHIFWSSVIRCVYTFIIISSWWTNTFIFMKCSFFLLLLMFCILKSNLSSVNIAYPAFCWLGFAWYLFLFFYCHSICTFMFKVGFL